MKPRGSKNPIHHLGRVALLLLLALGGVFVPRQGLGKAALEKGVVVIDGPDNTLASVARDLGRPKVFRYDPDTGTATSSANLRLQGCLTLGSEEPADELLRYNEVLQFDVAACGQVRIDVLRTPARVGELRLQRAKIQTFHDPHEAGDECATANVLDVAGRLFLRDSAIMGYLDGQFHDGAEIDIANSTIAVTQNCGLNLDAVDPGRIRIRDSFFLDNGFYGLNLFDLARPLTIRNAVFRGLAADVFNRGRADLVLVDCDLTSTGFASLSGTVTQKWTVTFRLPRRGLKVVAESDPADGQHEVVSGETDERGVCTLTLSEFVASRGHTQREEGVNNFTPHVVQVSDGQKLLYRIRNYHAIMKGQEIVLK